MSRAQDLLHRTASAIPILSVLLGVEGTSYPRVDFRPDLVQALGTERVDVIDLALAPPLLRFKVARDGIVLLVQVRLGRRV